MNRVSPLEWSEISEMHDLLAPVLDRVGFVPTSQLLMARRPKLLKAWIALTRAVYDPEGEVPIQLKNLVAIIASQASGCMYCQAHSSSNASRSGVSAKKIAALWEFEASSLFSKDERAALRFAMCAASVPNTVTDELVADLRTHFSDDQIVELMSVIALFGYLNRWNDSMATGLEDEPLSFAENALAGTTWTAGKHVEN